MRVEIMRSTDTAKQRAPPFGFIADILFQVIINGDGSTVLSLCLLNKATYDTIRLLEPHICKWFMRLHGVNAFDPVLTLCPWTGEQSALTVHTLIRFLYRQELACRLSLHIVPSVWGTCYDDEKAEVNFEVELKLAKRLERGLYVLFHMADISRGAERQKYQKASLPSLVTKRLTMLVKMLDEYSDFPLDQRKIMSFEEHTNHVYTVVKWGYSEAEIGKRRREFRSHLDDQTEIDFHCTVRMLRELLERMLLRHGPKYWHRDTRNEQSVISWFLLKQPPRTLAKLLLTPQDDCCHFDARSTASESRKCCFSDPLDDYWDAWKDIPSLGCVDCDCKRRVRSWSVKPTLMDARGREFNRAAERYLKEMWSQRHVGLQQAFTRSIFTTMV
ncbi:uncharacterized protein BJX67DRAFT_295500 [Aspergillus lucknowensis]|uniref:Uncharacterized protein n=1 Tax=Aspergillus lucknowensis TaxID=176173 RepID=A0ABR4LDH3_9EURO